MEDVQNKEGQEEVEVKEEVKEEGKDKKFQTIDAQKRHYREKAEKLEKEKEELEAKLKSLDKEPDEKVDEDIVSAQDYTDIKYNFPYLERSDINKAAKWAKEEGKSVDEILQSGFFKAYADEKYAEKKSAYSTPLPSNRANAKSSSNLEELNKKPGSYHSLSPEEKAKVRKELGM